MESYAVEERTSRAQGSKRPYLSIFGQILLLLKKNILIKKRGKKIDLILEIGYPIYILLALISLIRLNKDFGKLKRHEQFLPNETDFEILGSFPKMYSNDNNVHVVPNTQGVKEFMASVNSLTPNVTTRSDQYTHLKFEFYKDEEELIEAYKLKQAQAHVDGNSSNLQFLSIIFKEGLKYPNASISPEYVIRYVPGNFQGVPEFLPKKRGLASSCRETFRPDCNIYTDYFLSHYIGLQFLVDKVLIFRNQLERQTTNWTTKIKPYPIPASDEKPGLCSILPAYSFLACPLIVHNLLVIIVTEKSQKVKDGLKIIGVTDLAYWLSWYTLYAIIFGILSTVFSTVYYFMNMLQIDFIILFVVFMLFGVSLVSFTFVLSPFFHNPRAAGFLGIVITGFPIAFVYIQKSFEETISESDFLLLRLFNTYAFTAALDKACEIGAYGRIGLNDLKFGGRGEYISHSILFLIFDTVFYLLLAIYLDNVIPNSLGVRKSPIFFLKPSFWMANKSASNIEAAADETLLDGGISEQNANYEPVPRNILGTEAIQIRGIGKTYISSTGKTTEAVKSISMDIYENQITAILGKNGVGKSTLFNMLIGMVTPTKGTAYIFGYDIRDPMSNYLLKKMTGVCMQEDVHFGALTVEEHLKFYGKLRGLRNPELGIEIQNYLTALMLEEVRNTRAANLSGGQKRKLSIAICIIGDPKIIILDEPTAGLDPVSKRAFWTFLKNMKAERVILLSTHSMEEADVLADRKAIINYGVVKALGTSLFLKNRFGAGYHLTIELKDKDLPPEKLEAVLNKWSPSSLESKTIAGHSIIYSLPYSAIPNFPHLFVDLENLKGGNSSNVQSYGISMTTLEEVFLKISSDEEVLSPPGSVILTNTALDSTSTDNIINADLSTGDTVSDQDKKSNTFRTLVELCKLRIKRLYRKPMNVFNYILFPILLMLVILALAKINFGSSPKFVNFTKNDFYASGDMNIALFDEKNTTTLEKYLTANGFHVFNYDGSNNSNLLEINQPKGTMAAININSEDINNLQLTLLFNQSYIHAAPIVVNLVDRYLSSIPERQLSTNISITSKPFTKFEDKTKPRAFDFLVLLIFGTTFSLIPLGFVLEVVYDRQVHVKSQLRINGVSLKMYFTSMLLVYGGLHAIIITIQMIMAYCFGLRVFNNIYLFGITICLLYLYIIPSLLFSAIVSYIFKTVDAANSIFTLIYNVLGLTLSVIILTSIALWNENLHYVISAIDVYYVPFGTLYFINKLFLQCSAMGSCDELGLGDFWQIELWYLALVLCLQTSLFGWLLLLVDIRKQRGKPLSCSLMNTRASGLPVHPSEATPNDAVDSDVEAENSRVDSYFLNPPGVSPDVIAAQKVSKCYKKWKPTKRSILKKKAVNKVSFLMGDGVFGLLGHNGAGKTSLIKVLLADTSLDSGKVRICGYDIETNLQNAFQYLGYCPQHDALWDSITLKEHLQLYGAIRGLSPVKAKDTVHKFLVGLNIQEHSKKNSETLSGGTKRKLCYALSMIGGNQKAVLMDEPSTGLDPQSKRYLWNTIKNAFKDGRGALLTTHSMEEADALCNKIAIMAKGSFMCIGSPQHLKSKFGVGYTMEIRIPEPLDGTVEMYLINTIQNQNQNDLQQQFVSPFAFVEIGFPGSKLTECFLNRAVFSVPVTAVQSVSSCFSVLESWKENRTIIDYSFSQTTLEQIFLNIAKQSEEGTAADGQN